MRAVDISIVICTYNRSEMLRHALEGVIRQETDGKFSYELVVIDDGSTDDTRNVVKEFSKRSHVPVRYFQTEGEGISEARNIGVKETRSKWIAWFDDDQLAQTEWLKNLFAIALQKGGDCIAGTVQLSLAQEQLSRLGPVCRSILGEYIWCEKPAIYRGKTLPGTGNLMVSRRVFDSIGLFDTTLASSEDNDFLFRAQVAGFNVWIVPNAVVHHMVPSYRMKPAYFRWTSLRQGSNLAYRNCKQLGRGKTLLLCIARIGHAILLTMPYILLAYLRLDKTEMLDRQCLLWRAIGHTRRTLKLLLPRVFPQERFLNRLQFRIERKSFTPLNKKEQKIGRRA